MAPALPQIGPYRLTAKLGESDLAEVYCGEDTLFERAVAVKVLREQAADDRALVRRFLASGREAMRLRHPHIVRVYDVGQAGGRYFVATELVVGKSLHDELARGKGAWSAERAIALAGQVAEALDYAHGLGLVHLNLKPSNVLLADDGRVLVTDFDGEASPAWAGDPDHPLFSRLKSPAFLAPEQARGDDSVGPSADVYSLAALTYTLCAGRAPFAGRNPLGLLRQIAETPPPRADRIVPAVDQNLADALALALAKDPNKRQPTPSALVRSLVEGVQPVVEATNDDFEAFADEPGEPGETTPARSAPVAHIDTLPAPVAIQEPRRRFSTAALPAPTLALLTLASLAALLMLIAAMRSAGALMARLTDDPRKTPGIVEVVQNGTPTAVALLPTVTNPPVTAGPTATSLTAAETRASAAHATQAPTAVKSPTPTRAVAAPQVQQGLMAVAGRQVRMVEFVTPPPTANAATSPTPLPTTTATPTTAPTVTPVPTLTPVGSLDEYSLIGRIAYAQWNSHSDRPDVYIWDTKQRASGAPLPSYRQPDFGPHGLLIANAEGAGRDNLVQMGWLGENAAIVSAHPEDAHPHWSPDGKLVVFDSAHMGDRQHRIYLQDDLSRRDDRPPLMYLAWELFGRYPVFLGTGQIAYNGCNYWASGSVCGIYVVDTVGGMPASATGWPNDVPTDNLGARVLFMSDRGGNWDVFSVNADGGELRQLTSAPGIDGLATASPDGRAVAFLTNRDGRWSVYVMRPDGDAVTKLFDLPLGFGRDEYDWFQERLSWGY